MPRPQPTAPSPSPSPPSSQRSSPSTSQARPRRPTRLAAAQPRGLFKAQPRDSSAADSPEDPGERFGLAGLVALPIPDIVDIATVHKHVKERRSQLLERSSTQEVLIYYGATAAHIDAIHPVEKDAIYLGRITFFSDESGGLLYFKVPQPVHEAAHHCLFNEILFWIFQMGLQAKVQSIGSSRYKGIGSRQKEGDSGILSSPPRWAGNHFPTLVTEAGNLESVRLLRKDKDWRFDNLSPIRPQDDVKIVLLIKVERQSKRVIVEKWYCGWQFPSQVVVITPHPDKEFSMLGRAHWSVAGAPMTIPFEHVFLRPAQGNGDRPGSQRGVFYHSSNTNMGEG